VHTILIVDDESNMRFLIRLILESGGFEVVEAPHGSAALERARESRPALIVTDLMMPVMTGRELIEHLRADPGTASIPIVVVSANSSTVATAADAVLEKPFNPTELLDVVRSRMGIEHA